MAVIKQDDGLWLVDISDGKSSLTGKRIRHRKSNFLTLNIQYKCTIKTHKIF